MTGLLDSLNREGTTVNELQIVIKQMYAFYFTHSRFFNKHDLKNKNKNKNKNNNISITITITIIITITITLTVTLTIAIAIPLTITIIITLTIMITTCRMVGRKTTTTKNNIKSNKQQQ